MSVDKTDPNDQKNEGGGDDENPFPSDFFDVLKVIRDRKDSELQKLKELPEEERKGTARISRGEVDKFEEKQKEERLKSLQQDRKERKRYAERIFQLICIWLFSVFLLLMITGHVNSEFEISDTVLLAIIGGTTANVLGIFIIVAKYLFPSNNQ